MLDGLLRNMERYDIGRCIRSESRSSFAFVTECWVGFATSIALRWTLEIRAVFGVMVSSAESTCWFIRAVLGVVRVVGLTAFTS